MKCEYFSEREYNIKSLWMRRKEIWTYCIYNALMCVYIVSDMQ